MDFPETGPVYFWAEPASLHPVIAPRRCLVSKACVTACPEHAIGIIGGKAQLVGAPFASEPKFQPIREHKKINAGAQFFQTNLVYDPQGMETWLNELAKRNILDKVYILIGVTPIKSLKVALRMNKEVPGVTVPGHYLKRLEAAGDKTEEEGVQITLELIQAIKKYLGQGEHGIHVMAIGWEEIEPRIVRESGLLPEGFVEPAPAEPKKAAAPA